jgi:hypothetical protein
VVVVVLEGHRDGRGADNGHRRSLSERKVGGRLLK